MLLGPQGTLYGAGTLAGAVRYLPRRPDTERRTFEVRGDLFALGWCDRARSRQFPIPMRGNEPNAPTCDPTSGAEVFEAAGTSPLTFPIPMRGNENNTDPTPDSLNAPAASV